MNREFYENGDVTQLMAKKYIQLGQICAVRHENKWYRGEINEHNPDNVATVHLVDYAIYREIAFDDIKVMDDQFAQIPIHALCGCLSGIQPLDRQWTEPARDEFTDIIDGKILFANVNLYNNEVFI